MIFIRSSLVCDSNECCNIERNYIAINAHSAGAQPGYRRCKLSCGAACALTHLSPAKKNNLETFFFCLLAVMSEGNTKLDRGVVFALLNFDERRVRAKEPVVVRVSEVSERRNGVAAHGNCCCAPAVQRRPHFPTPPTHPPYALALTLIKQNWITHSHTTKT